MQNKSISLCSRRAVPEYQCMYIYMYLFWESDFVTIKRKLNADARSAANGALSFFAPKDGGTSVISMRQCQGLTSPYRILSVINMKFAQTAIFIRCQQQKYQTHTYVRTYQSPPHIQMLLCCGIWREEEMAADWLKCWEPGALRLWG